VGVVKKMLEWLLRLVRWKAPAPGRFTLNQKSSLHGFISVAPAPPWRDYLLYVPRGADGVSRLPLVVWIHGCRQDPEEFDVSIDGRRNGDLFELNFGTALATYTITTQCQGWLASLVSFGRTSTPQVSVQMAAISLLWHQ